MVGASSSASASRYCSSPITRCLRTSSASAKSAISRGFPAAHRDPVGVPAAGTRSRLGHDLLPRTDRRALCRSRGTTPAGSGEADVVEQDWVLGCLALAYMWNRLIRRWSGQRPASPRRLYRLAGGRRLTPLAPVLPRSADFPRWYGRSGFSGVLSTPLGELPPGEGEPVSIDETVDRRPAAVDRYGGSGGVGGAGQSGHGDEQGPEAWRHCGLSLSRGLGCGLA